MGINEARLRNMIDPDTGRAWDLNEADRAAIRWAFARIETLEAEREECRQRYFETSRAFTDYRNRVEAAIKGIGEIT